MLDDESTPTPDMTPEPAQDEEPNTSSKPAKKTTAKKAAAKKTTAKKATTKKATTKKAATKKAAASRAGDAPEDAPPAADADAPTADQPPPVAAEQPAEDRGGGAEAPAAAAGAEAAPESTGPAPAAVAPLFRAPDSVKATPSRRSRKKAESAASEPEAAADTAAASTGEAQAAAAPGGADDEGDEAAQRRRRRRGGRRRRKDGDADSNDTAEDPSPATVAERQPGDTSDRPEEGTTSRRRRRRRRQGEGEGVSPDDPEKTVVRVREPRQAGDDEISAVTGSTRLEAKKQRRREGREAGRRRAPIVSEAEFLARREAVDRVMAVRQRDGVTQIGVLEDGVLVEHYVARESQTSLIGNVYLGRVQNVLPSMEAAFVDIGKGRNAVLYAGEVNWGVLGKEGQPRRIETALKSGQTILVQVTKDPAGHKGARLTSQISLPGRYLVYLPGGQTSGISRKLADTERNRLKNLLKDVLPEDAGVIVRTAAEGASEEELRRDVTRLTARWDDICKKVERGQAPQLLYGEPDLMIKVIRDLFTEDFKQLVVSGDDAWDMIEGYVNHVAPDLMDRVQRWQDGTDLFASYRVDEQIAKALERKVWLPSGGSLVIDRTEAMTVIDVNTGKFTGSGGNLEETVTKNNLEAAEEIVRQLRLRDIGGIIVVDFIDMVLESNRDLVLRRLVECLGRDRTRHQVAEVTSLGLVQMTRKRIGTGLLEAFSEPCEACQGRGLHTHLEPVDPKQSRHDSDDSRRGGRRVRRGGDGSGDKGKKQESKQESRQEPKQESRQDREQDGKPKSGDRRRPDSKPAEGKPAEGKPAEGKPAEEQRAATMPAVTPPAEAAPAEAAPAEAPVEAAPAGTSPEQTAPEQAAAQQAASEQAPPERATAPTVGSTDGVPQQQPEKHPASGRRQRRRAASRPAGPPAPSEAR